MRGLISAGLLAASLLVAASTASAADITADGTGWINASGGSNAGGFASGTHNNFSGFEGGIQYNNWFSFVLPNSAITSATLNVFNAGNNSTIDPDAVYDLHAASGYTFAGLADGASLGSIMVSAADTGTGHLVSITLNALGIGYLNSNLGSAVQFGGVISTAFDTSSCNDCIAAFGYTDGSPTATLSLNAVPEPATWALMIVGFGLVGTTLRRRTAVAA